MSNKYDEDKILDLVTEEIARRIESEEKEINNRLLDVPEGLDRKTYELIKETIAYDEARNKKSRKKVMLQRVAVISIVFLSILHTFAFSTVEAYRFKVLSLMPNKEEGAVRVMTESEQEMLAGWNNYWYPGYLPESYELVEAYDCLEKILVFASTEDGSAIRLTSYEAGTTISYDSDTTTIHEITISEYPAKLFLDETAGYTAVTWKTENHFVDLYFSKVMDTKVVAEIAEELYYTK